MERGRGVVVLVLGILGITVASLFAAIPAWIMGNIALEDIRRGRLDPSERGMVEAGRVLGIVSVCLHGCVLVVWLGLFGLFATAIFTSHGVH